jgi:iron complex transport system substrate-binding protein
MKKPGRIVSFLPSATEMVCSLGLVEKLVGISHECDFPSEIKGKPVVVKSAISVAGMTPGEIDTAVRNHLKMGTSLYEIDEKLLTQLAPDLIIAQDLCQVCAPSGREVTQVLKFLPSRPEVLWLKPNSLEQIFDNLLDVGKATGRLKEAEEIITSGKNQIENIQEATSRLSYRPRVFCVEWIDPIYCSGHWIAEMIELAGGIDKFSRKGIDSVPVCWEEVLDWDPEILIFALCGFSLEKAVQASSRVREYPKWDTLTAVKEKRVYVVDANSYFARPGPRVIEGLDLLVRLIHPLLLNDKTPVTPYRGKKYHSMVWNNHQ